MTENREPSRVPSHEAFIVEGDGDKAHWTKIGALWPHDDGKGFTLKLTCLPLDGRMSIRQRQPRKEMGR